MIERIITNATIIIGKIVDNKGKTIIRYPIGKVTETTKNQCHTCIIYLSDGTKYYWNSKSDIHKHSKCRSKGRQ